MIEFVRRLGRVLRRVGIALGSLMIAYLAVMVVAGPLLGQTHPLRAWLWVVIVVLGAVVYAQIMRRERGQAFGSDRPTT